MPSVAESASGIRIDQPHETLEVLHPFVEQFQRLQARSRLGATLKPQFIAAAVMREQPSSDDEAYELANSLTVAHDYIHNQVGVPVLGIRSSGLIAGIAHGGRDTGFDGLAVAKDYAVRPYKTRLTIAARTGISATFGDHEEITFRGYHGPSNTIAMATPAFVQDPYKFIDEPEPILPKVGVGGVLVVGIPAVEALLDELANQEHPRFSAGIEKAAHMARTLLEIE